ncbi:MAG: hypothetical protein MUC78_05880 [Bacteroidales bacterium]|jgi:hypothetical protein|nr:hypothetical protein [Bacteroidales bacterium]
MNKATHLLILAAMLSLQAVAQGEIPKTEISNKIIRATIYLPDEQSGYYRGTRFDWSGVMPELEYNGHSYFGQWFEKYDPVLHDAIMGPVEEFGPLGYDEADTGAVFVKIGVGALLKPKEERYNRFNYYRIQDPGTWKISKKSGQVTFMQVLEHKNYGYKYKKTVKLVKGKPVMEITHSLENTGQKTIQTNAYNHNFFVIDGRYTGPGLKVTFPFALKVDSTRISKMAEVKENAITFKRELVMGETTSLGSLTGFGADAKDYDIRIENQITGAGVRITGDKPITRLIFWASLKVLSPEPYINITVEPGQEFSWKIRYEFYTLNASR